MSTVDDPGTPPESSRQIHSVQRDLPVHSLLAGSDESHQAEIARLEAAIAAVNARAAAATARRAALEAEMRELMRKELLEAQAQLLAMDRAHEQRVAEVRVAAAAEVERILHSPRAGDLP